MSDFIDNFVYIFRQKAVQQIWKTGKIPIKWGIVLFGTGNVLTTGMERILIIDDCKTDQEMIRQHYCENCQNFDFAACGEEAFYLLNRFDYDLIIISNDLPDLNGTWIIQHLKKTVDSKIILTSYFNHGVLERMARRLDVSFISKPMA